MAFSERVNMEILKRFNEASIEFAFPTQTLYLAGDPNRPLKWGEEG
jgi:MscS family membrane protein